MIDTTMTLSSRLDYVKRVAIGAQEVNERLLNDAIYGRELHGIAENQLQILLDHPNQYINHEFTSYQCIQKILAKLSPRKSDVVYDLGSGRGRFVLFGAIGYDAEFVGIEIVRERAEFSANVSNELKLRNTKFVCEDIFDTKIQEATAVFSFNPVYKKDLEKLAHHICENCTNPKVTLAISRPLADFVLMRERFKLMEVIKFTWNISAVEFCIIESKARS